MNKNVKSVILASASPRRKELLSLAGIDFDIRPAVGKELYIASQPDGIVKELSQHKAQEAAANLDKEGSPDGACWVIGADTIVYAHGRILGKPADEEEAAATLRLLQDSTHQVYTGVTVMYRESPGQDWRQVVFDEKTDVTFYPVSDEEIAAYVSTKDPMDKAGSYAIQGPWAVYVRGICGDYNNVVGLPLARLIHEAKAAGFPLPRRPGISGGLIEEW